MNERTDSRTAQLSSSRASNIGPCLSPSRDAPPWKHPFLPFEPYARHVSGTSDGRSDFSQDI
ncbi:UNVERIFIED_ORG: hypothetical protein QOE_3333 [Clostridioides difficile F501]